jgi:predicted outer membrane protein
MRTPAPIVTTPIVTMPILTMMILTLLCLCGASAAEAPQDSTAQLSDTEKSFVDAIAANDLAEMQMSKLIGQKSSSKSVRRLAQTILTEDTANYEQLFKLCLRRHYAISAQLDERQRSIVQELRDAHSHVLGRKYLDAILVDESGLDKLLAGVAQHELDNDVEKFASDSAQMIAHHAQQARELVSK